MHITVRDDGPGIAPDVLPRVFDPFVTTKEAGVGLGLMLARQAAEGEGGDLTWGYLFGDYFRLLGTYKLEWVQVGQNASGLSISIEQVSYFPPCPFESGCVEAVRKGAAEFGYSSMDAVSGAGTESMVEHMRPT